MNISNKISALETRLRATKSKKAYDSNGIPELSNETIGDTDTDICASLLENLEVDLASALLSGLLLGKVLRPDLSVTIQADLREIRAAVSSLNDLLGDYINPEGASNITDVATVAFDDTTLNKYGKMSGKVQSKIASLEKRLR